ncbi:hypothetical protein ACK4A3_18405, partial [Aeromonas veronii]
YLAVNTGDHTPESRATTRPYEGMVEGGCSSHLFLSKASSKNNSAKLRCLEGILIPYTPVVPRQFVLVINWHLAI